MKALTNYINFAYPKTYLIVSYCIVNSQILLSIITNILAYSEIAIEKKQASIVRIA